MKKYIIASLALIAATTGSAQTVSFGIKGGVASSSIISSQKFDGNKYVQGTSGIGAQIGGLADFKFNQSFSIQPNLLFIYKTGQVPEAILSGKVTMLSIDVPLNFLYHNAGFFVGAGPNFSYGLSAKYKPFDDGDEDFDLYEETGPDNESYLKRFEIGVNALMGYQFPSGLTLQANFTPGLSNLYNFADDDDDEKITTRYFGLSIGYNFGKK